MNATNAETIKLEVLDLSLDAMVEHTENGWGAACRFPDSDFMVSHAKSRDKAISALSYILSHDMEDMAMKADEIQENIGARWEIRAYDSDIVV